MILDCQLDTRQIGDSAEHLCKTRPLKLGLLLIYTARTSVFLSTLPYLLRFARGVCEVCIQTWLKDFSISQDKQSFVFSLVDYFAFISNLHY